MKAKTRKQRKAEFIAILAEYLGTNLPFRIIELRAGLRSGQEWQQLWQAAGLTGYPTVEEIAAELEELLK